MRQFIGQYGHRTLATSLTVPAKKLQVIENKPIISKISANCYHHKHGTCFTANCSCDCHQKLENSDLTKDNSSFSSTILPTVLKPVGNIAVDAMNFTTCNRCGATAGKLCHAPNGRTAKKTHKNRIFVYKVIKTKELQEKINRLKLYI